MAVVSYRSLPCLVVNWSSAQTLLVFRVSSIRDLSVDVCWRLNSFFSQHYHYVPSRAKRPFKRTNVIIKLNSRAMGVKKKKKKMMPFQKSLGALLKLLNKKKKASGSLFTCILFHSLFSSPWILVSRPRGWPFAIMGLHRYDGSPHQQHRNQNQTSHTDFFFLFFSLFSLHTKRRWKFSSSTKPCPYHFRRMF